MPTSWESFRQALSELDRSGGEGEAIVLHGDPWTQGAEAAAAAARRVGPS